MPGEQKDKSSVPDNTAVRTALWRALHVQADDAPYILEDTIGLQMIAPAEGWQEQPDMLYTKRLRASIVARARFIEDLVMTQVEKGVHQYIILGAGLDSFAQRHPEMHSRLQIFEIDRTDMVNWKKQRLEDLGLGIPEYLNFVPVDFEMESWSDKLRLSGFDPSLPAVIACTGVSIYLTKEAIVTTLEQIAKMAPGSTLAMTFYLPIHLLDEEDQFIQVIGEKGAREAGTPFISFITPQEVSILAISAGFKDVVTIPTNEMNDYFVGRTDGLKPASGEFFLVAGL
jgi:methyltransferase (TIGR00027 family)